MPWKYTEEYYKNYTRETWDESASHYLPILQRLQPYHQALLQTLKPEPGLHVLDVATGPGEPAMSIASMVAPTGRVTGIDLSQNMIELASKTAAKRKITNVEFQNMDAEKLDLAANTFDLATSCFGFQIITNPEAAAKEMLRVLKHKGRVGLTVWSKGDKAPALDVMIGPMLEHAEPDETGYLPTPYELGGPGELTAMLEQVGFKDTAERRVNYEWHASDAESYLQMILEGTPLGHSLREEEPETQKKILEKTRANITRYSTSDGVKLPAECVIVTAFKP